MVFYFFTIRPQVPLISHVLYVFSTGMFFDHTFCVLFLRPVEEEVTNAKTTKDEEGFKSKGPQLLRKNSSKNLVSNF